MNTSDSDDDNDYEVIALDSEPTQPDGGVDKSEDSVVKFYECDDSYAHF